MGTRRRAFLMATGGICVVAAGCLSASDAPGDESGPADDPEAGDDSESEPDGGPEETNSNSNNSDADASDGDAIGAFDVSLERPAHVLSMAEQWPREGPAQVTAASELNALTRAAIEAAAADDEGIYETDEPSGDLLEGLHRLSYVEYDGTVYECTRRMPEHVVTGTEVGLDDPAVDPDATIGTMDDRIRVLGVDNREIVSAVNAVVRRDGPTGGEYRATVLDEDLEEFLETYDYVAYPHDGEDGPEPEGYVRLEYSFEDPGAPYRVALEELPDEERYGRPVVDAESYDEAVAKAFATAAERRQYRTDELPAGIRDAVAEDVYVRVDGSVYEPDLRDVPAEPVPASLEIRDVDEDERSFTLVVENQHDDEIRIWSGAPAPFGVLGGRASDGGRESEDGRRATLWSDAYEENRHVHVDEDEDERRITVNDIGLSTPLEADESMAETYEARPEWGFDPGEYVVEFTLSAEWGARSDGESGGVPATIVIRVPDDADGDVDGDSDGDT